MLRRLLSLIVLCWVLGFIVFAVSLPRPVDGPLGKIGTGRSGAGNAARGTAVIVLTGAEGRIARGLEVLRRGWAGQMLVSGVDPEVQPGEFASDYHVDQRLMQCCITLGSESVDTRSNAQEALKWVQDRHITSVRLVTSDWHMRRAAWELQRVLPAQVPVIEDAVPTRPSLNTLFVEYCKLLAQRIAGLRHK
jgi:uncharacterized SAM-binding protein YcdF (DUF218 family)